MTTLDSEVMYETYENERTIDEIQALVSKDLSEPYSIYTYRYFLHNWPQLCICAFISTENSEKTMIGTVVCKAEQESDCFRGYIAMLAVNSDYRKLGIGHKMASTAIDRMVELGCEEIVLEAESSNIAALALYEKLGFSRDEKLVRYYLNGGDAFRLKLWIDNGESKEQQEDGDNFDSAEVISKQIINVRIDS